MFILPERYSRRRPSIYISGGLIHVPSTVIVIHVDVIISIISSKILDVILAVISIIVYVKVSIVAVVAISTEINWSSSAAVSVKISALMPSVPVVI